MRMLDTIISAVCRICPDVRLFPAPGRVRGRCIIYRIRPSRSQGRRKSARLEMKFVGESLADAYSLYMRVRDAIVSRADERRIGEGVHALSVEEIAEGGRSGYIQKTGMYYVSAGFYAVGY